MKRTHLDARMAHKARDTGADLREGFEVATVPLFDAASGLWDVTSAEVPLCLWQHPVLRRQGPASEAAATVEVTAVNRKQVPACRPRTPLAALVDCGAAVDGRFAARRTLFCSRRQAQCCMCRDGQRTGANCCTVSETMPGVTPVQGETVRGRTLVLADGATSRMAMQMGYCTEPPKGVCSRAYVEGGTHNADFDGGPPPPSGARLMMPYPCGALGVMHNPPQARWHANSLAALFALSSMFTGLAHGCSNAPIMCSCVNHTHRVPNVR